MKTCTHRGSWSHSLAVSIFYLYMQMILWMGHRWYDNNGLWHLWDFMMWQCVDLLTPPHPPHPSWTWLRFSLAHWLLLTLFKFSEIELIVFVLSLHSINTNHSFCCEFNVCIWMFFCSWLMSDFVTVSELECLFLHKVHVVNYLWTFTSSNLIG